ncbi:phytoene desaturase family protein [Pelosinus baikalensis]|uniref:NAD(P)/FAD-dependent oxidoreductase n=1 Tax=Pelosinus baikalensis TaxID=2892015 RepID=A0ABS8HWG9_9FIRM|nr:NAD(P)/FAD-dependent oxidoreductase [Pelosinus baikalensis]
MTNQEKSIIIIGAGAAGLAAGIYGQMNGYKTNIFEMHNIPGGLSTAWKRKGYTFDGGMDWIVGIDPKMEEHLIWRELGALKGKKVAFYDELFRIKDREGKICTFYADPKKFEEELSQFTSYGEDLKKIKHLCKSIGRFSKAPSFSYKKPENLYGFFDKLAVMLKFLPYMGILTKYNGVMISDFAKEFRDPRLREIISYIFYNPDIAYSVFPPLFTLANMYNKNAGYPEGGALGLGKSFEARYKELGGQVEYEKRVKKIIVKDNRAIGILLADGTEHFADIVISACDGRTTIYDLLEGKYLNDDINRMYKEATVHPSMVRVFLGVNQDFKNEPHTAIYLKDKPVEVSGLISKNQNSILVRHYCHTEPSYSPSGKSVLTSFFIANYDEWKELYKDRERYKKEKEKVADIVIEHLEQTYPGIRKKIEYVDVSTPVTIERYTGNYKGSIMGWIATSEIDVWSKRVGMTLSNLDNFYMIGQWVVYGGVIRVVGSGRFVIQMQCDKDQKKFATMLD